VTELKKNIQGSRRKARETALRALYLSESRGITVDEAFKEMAAIDREMETRADEPDIESLKPFGLGISGESLDYARVLAHMVEDSRDPFNERIGPVLKNWDLKRVSRIDRIILWIALAELQSMLDVPPAVAIDEAVEMARKYSSHKSPGFVNGVLDALARSMGAKGAGETMIPKKMKKRNDRHKVVKAREEGQ
jgi:transcription antitermination factor NusB